MWSAIRASGLVAYGLLWLQVCTGLSIRRPLAGKPAYHADWHGWLGLWALGFLAVHITLVLLDTFQPFTLRQAFVPGAATYRGFWVALGTIGLYLLLLVLLTTFLRRLFKPTVWRALHQASFFAWLAALAHGLGTGFDGNTVWAQSFYGITAVVVLVLWIRHFKRKRPSKRPAVLPDSESVSTVSPGLPNGQCNTAQSR